jgi:tRNA threonylcarbamoyladenosine biosynthesis protein TsaE
MSRIVINSLNELPLSADSFIPLLQNHKIFAFYGEMGVGKTTFIKELCKAMGITQEVTSPTFALVNEYLSPKFGLIYHFDFYRIEKVSEIYDMGFEEYTNSNSYIFIEWPEKLESLLPKEALIIKITETTGGARVISW